MPLLVTPRSLAKHAELHRQLAQFTTAGISLVPALEHIRNNPPDFTFRRPIQIILDQLNDGTTFTEAIRATRSWMPQFDTALIEAGERSGRLDSCFSLLAEYYENRASAARQAISGLIYPLLIVHVAAFLMPLPQLVLKGNLTLYLQQSLGVLLPLYIVGFLLLYASQGRHGEWWRAIVEAIVRVVPVLGTARRYLALSRLAAALEALLNAGMPITQAWAMAASASGSPALNRAVGRWLPRVEAGETPAEALRDCRAFPDLFTNFYQTGEVSGSLDDSLKRIQRYYHDEGTRRMKAVAWWFPRLIYFMILGVVAFIIIQFYRNFYGQILNGPGF
jgi:type II secretory pathway component PulF